MHGSCRTLMCQFSKCSGDELGPSAACQQEPSLTPGGFLLSGTNPVLPLWKTHLQIWRIDTHFLFQMKQLLVIKHQTICWLCEKMWNYQMYWNESIFPHSVGNFNYSTSLVPSSHVWAQNNIVMKTHLYCTSQNIVHFLPNCSEISRNWIPHITDEKNGSEKV